MVDDEADELEVRRVLREIASDPDLKRKWSRYHAISSALKREGRSNLKESDLVDVLFRAGRECERVVARDQLVVAARDQERRAGRRRGLGPPRRAGNDQRLEAWQAIGHRERAGAS